MSVLKRGNNWYIDFRFNYVRYRKRSPDNSKAGAEAYESILRHKLARGEPIVEVKYGQTITFKAFSDIWMKTYVETNNKWSEQKNKRTMLRANLLPYFGDKKLNEITSQKIEEYKALKRQTGLKNKSINNHVSCLRKCLNMAMEWEYLEDVPRMKLLKVPPTEINFLTIEECNKLLAVAKGEIYDMIFVALRTGLRFGELIALKWSDIDYVGKILIIQRSISEGKLGSTKGNKIRKIPIMLDLLDFLTKKKKHSEYIFANEAGNPMKQAYCCDRMKELFKKAGIKHTTWHMLRHTFASHLANNGINIQAIKELLGHTDIKTTMRYAHIAPSTLVDAINTLHDHSFGIWTQGGHKINNVLFQLAPTNLQVG